MNKTALKNKNPVAGNLQDRASLDIFGVPTGNIRDTRKLILCTNSFAYLPTNIHNLSNGVQIEYRTSLDTFVQSHLQNSCRIRIRILIEIGRIFLKISSAKFKFSLAQSRLNASPILGAPIRSRGPLNTDQHNHHSFRPVTGCYPKESYCPEGKENGTHPVY